jgi:hypothetical protein
MDIHGNSAFDLSVNGKFHKEVLHHVPAGTENEY